MYIVKVGREGVSNYINKLIQESDINKVYPIISKNNFNTMSLFEYMLPLAFVGALSGPGSNGLKEFNKHMMNYLKMIQAEENKNKESAAKREKEQGDVPSPKRMKLDESNDVITSEDESHDKEDVKSVKGIFNTKLFQKLQLW